MESVSLLNLHPFLPLLNIILIFFIAILKENSEVYFMDLLFLCLMGIFFGMTSYLIGGFDTL